MKQLFHGNIETSFRWPDVLSNTNQLRFGKRSWNLAVSSAAVEFRFRWWLGTLIRKVRRHSQIASGRIVRRSCSLPAYIPCLYLYLPCQHTVNTVWQELSIYPTHKLFITYGIYRVNRRYVWRELSIYPTQVIYYMRYLPCLIYLNGNVLGI